MDCHFGSIKMTLNNRILSKGVSISLLSLYWKNDIVFSGAAHKKGLDEKAPCNLKRVLEWILKISVNFDPCAAADAWCYSIAEENIVSSWVVSCPGSSSRQESTPATLALSVCPSQLKNSWMTPPLLLLGLCSWTPCWSFLTESQWVEIIS